MIDHNLHWAVQEPELLAANDYNPKQEQLVGRLEWSLPFAKIGAGVLQCAAGVVQKAPGAIWDSLHGVGDFFGFIRKLQLISLRSGENERSIVPESRFGLWNRFRHWTTNTATKDEAQLEKSSNKWTALPALGAVALAGANIANEVVGNPETTPGFDWWDVAHLGTASAAFAVALGIWRLGSNMKHKVDHLENPSPGLKEIVWKFYHHGRLDTASSGLALFEAGIHSATSSPAALIAVNSLIVAVAAKQFWDFRWWKKGHESDDEPHEHKEHDHHHANHSHEDCDHVHLVPHEVLDAGSKLARNIRNIGATATGRWRQSQQLKEQRKQAYRESAWWNWVEATCKQPNNPLANWAERELQEKPDFPELKQSVLSKFYQKLLKG